MQNSKWSLIEDLLLIYLFITAPPMLALHFEEVKVELRMTGLLLPTCTAERCRVVVEGLAEVEEEVVPEGV